MKLIAILEETPRHDMLVITGGMNAKGGSEVQGYERVGMQLKAGTRTERDYAIFAT